MTNEYLDMLRHKQYDIEKIETDIKSIDNIFETKDEALFIYYCRGHIADVQPELRQELLTKTREILVNKLDKLKKEFEEL